MPHGPVPLLVGTIEIPERWQAPAFRPGGFGPDVGLFVDHIRIVHLECLRFGIWGIKSLRGRVQTCRE